MTHPTPSAVLSHRTPTQCWVIEPRPGPSAVLSHRGWAGPWLAKLFCPCGETACIKCHQMGVYVIQHRSMPWVKVGHHKVTKRRPTLQHRLRRGFRSCRHPADLEGRLGPEYFSVMGWFPTLGLLDEHRAHLICSQSESVGEFHPAGDLPRVLRLLRSRTAVSK